MDKKAFIQILELAIKNEVEAFEFYHSVAVKTRDTSLKQIFQELAEAEEGHKKALESFLKDGIQNFSFAVSPDYKLAESMDMPVLSIEMKPAEAIALAIKKEEEAMNMYKSFASLSDDNSQSTMFLELSKMEQGHKARLENIYTDIAYVEVW